jgi:hypothetical protein
MVDHPFMLNYTGSSDYHPGGSRKLRERPMRVPATGVYLRVPLFDPNLSSLLLQLSVDGGL